MAEKVLEKSEKRITGRKIWGGLLIGIGSTGFIGIMIWKLGVIPIVIGIVIVGIFIAGVYLYND